MTAAPTTYSAGGIVINKNREILLVQEFGEYWGLPRGHVEEGEDALTAAIREIKEEAGITDLTKVAELGFYVRSTFDSDGQPNFAEIKHITHFAFLTEQLEATPRDKDITDLGWFAPAAAIAKFINREDIEFVTQSIKTLERLQLL